MNYIHKYKPAKIWFRRWSNKPWAIFRSLHVVVHILQLKTCISKQSELKREILKVVNLLVSFFGLYHLFDDDIPDSLLLNDFKFYPNVVFIDTDSSVFFRKQNIYYPRFMV